MIYTDVQFIVASMFGLYLTGWATGFLFYTFKNFVEKI